MTDPLEADERIAVARERLAAKLTELRRRQASVVTALAPLRHLANPWLGVGLAVFVGYRFGRPRVAEAAASAPPRIAETLLHAIVRTGAITVVQALARHATNRIVDTQ